MLGLDGRVWDWQLHMAVGPDHSVGTVRRTLLFFL
jgi:hypothetical protein